MKKFICLFALAFATLTVASCDKTNDDETIEPGKLIERKDIVLTISFFCSLAFFFNSIISPC